MKINYIYIGNLKIEYTTLGKGDDLLFLHGAGANIRNNKLLLLSLSKHFRVWALSLPGAGKSSNLPKMWNFSDYSRIINLFCNSFKIKPFIAGHSLGGAIAISIKANFPKKYKNIILISSAGIHQKRPNKVILRVVVNSMRDLLKIHNWKQGIAYNAVLNIFYHPIDMIRIALIFRKTDLEDDIKKIQERVLILWGKDDDTLPISQLDIFKKLLKDKKVYVFKGSHNFLSFKNEEIADIIYQELKS